MKPRLPSTLPIALTTTVLVLLIVFGLAACATNGRPPCGPFDRGFPLCGI